MLSRTLFHPSVTAWFEEQFKVSTSAQAEAWPLIKAGRNVLIAAPTGSGKTLAAALAAIDTLCLAESLGLRSPSRSLTRSPCQVFGDAVVTGSANRCVSSRPQSVF
jgi:Lhr-like helicase